jgi:REP element-mobilizing transposase RayT
LSGRSAGFQPASVPFHPDDPAYHEGLHSRGYLPHLKRDGATYFVTFRLTDSLPIAALARLTEQRALRPGPALDLDAWLDRGTGSCALREASVARLVGTTLRHFAGERYLLGAWVVMPNHVHALVAPFRSHPLGSILKSWKQHSALRANRLLGRPGGRFWQPESYGHWVRDAAAEARITSYIIENPVHAGLCARPEDWPWSSAARGSE